MATSFTVIEPMRAPHATVGDDGLTEAERQDRADRYRATAASRVISQQHKDEVAKRVAQKSQR